MSVVAGPGAGWGGSAGGGDPGRDGEPLGLHGAGAGPGECDNGQCSDGSGQVVGDHHARQPCRVGGDQPGREVFHSNACQMRVDLFDGGMVTVLGLAGQRRGGPLVNTEWYR